MQINAERLHDSLDQMARIGATPGRGVTRLALSDEDKAARDLLRQWMEGAGLQVRIDDFGNMIGLRPGTAAGPPVRLGSHADSQPRGGRYDGILGVLGALEVIRTLNDVGIETARPIELVNWTNEEGARFEPAMQCSGAVAGAFSRQYVYDRTDQQGMRFEDALRRIDYQGEEANRPGPAAAYLELHIEQGPALEAAGVAVGVVEGIVGITWQEVTLVGQADHAGPSPMALRHDALVAAAEVIAAVDAIPRGIDTVGVGTVGRLAVEPNVINIIPGTVTFSVDFRHPDGAILERMAQQLAARAAEVAAAHGVRCEINRFWTSEPTPFDAGIVSSVQHACDKLELPSLRLWSGAGHDAKYMADISPTGMIFVRSQGGLSHCEQEYSTPDDIEAGANVLLLATARLAKATIGPRTREVEDAFPLILGA